MPIIKDLYNIYVYSFNYLGIHVLYNYRHAFNLLDVWGGGGGGGLDTQRVT